MLILVAVTVRTVIQSGLFGHAGKATSGYSMHEAREQLGTTLAGAMAEKYTNKDYNEDDFLDEYIKDNLPGSQIAGDVVLVDGWTFELDRTVPEIVNDLGKGNPEDFKSPELTVTKGDLSEDKLSIPLNITALESTNGISKIEVYKVGEKDPVETFNCSNETAQITKTYTATENAKYKIVAYSKLRATKTIEITELVPPLPTVKDAYVRYTPDDAPNYTGLTEATSGSSSNPATGIPQDTTLKWKVLSMNSDGTIDLIADKPISTQVCLQGSLGYNNGVYLLNDFCKSQYSNASLGTQARSINLEDIEKHFNDEARAARDSYSDKGQQYSQSYTYNAKPYWSNTPDIYKNHDKNIIANLTNMAQIQSQNYYSTPTTLTSTEENSLTITQTAYTIASNASYYDNPNFHTLIFGTNTNYWIASRCTGDYSFSGFPIAMFGLYNISGINLSCFHLYLSDGVNTLAGSFAVRPVVTLGSEYTLKLVSNSSNEWEIVKK